MVKTRRFSGGKRSRARMAHQTRRLRRKRGAPSNRVVRTVGDDDGGSIETNYYRYKPFLDQLISQGGEETSVHDFVASNNEREINNLMSAMRYHLEISANSFRNTAYRAQEEANSQSWKVLSLIDKITSQQ